MKKNISIYFFIIFVSGLFFLPGPKIFGDWESLYFFHNFGSLNYFLDFKISPRASLGTPGYSLLEISRLFVEKFNLDLNFENIRIPSKIYGVVSIFLFFFISKRFFGILPSIFASCLLATNPNFFIYTNSTTVIMVSALGFLLLIERLQKIEIDYKSWFNWLSLSAPLFLISLNYGLIRIYSAIIILTLLIKFHLKLRKQNEAKAKILNLYKKFLVTLIFTFIILSAVNFENLFSLIFFPTFIIPFDADSIFITKIFSPEASVSFLETIIINSKILFESILGLKGNFHEGILFNSIIGYRYPILNLFYFILSFLGFFICIMKFKKKMYIFSNPYSSIVFLALVCSIPILSSTVFKNGYELSVTLSTYRIFYLLFPIYLFIAVFIFEILERFKKIKFLKEGLYFALVLMLIINIGKINNENKKFDDLLLEAEKKYSLISPNAHWTNNEKYLSGNRNFTIHFDKHRDYIRMASEIGIQLNNKKKENTIINLNPKNFKFNKHSNFHFLNNYDFNTTFLSFYLNDINIKTAWIQDISQSSKTNIIGFSKNNIFPIKANNQRLKPIVMNKEKKRFALRYHSKKNVPSIILAVNESQKKFAEEYFFEKNIPFAIINY